KIMMATGSALTFNNCVLTRARMGPEIASTGLVLTNSYIMEMHGPDDCDGFYLHDSGGQSLLITGCVIADGDDDAVDTLDANVTIDNCIMRDWPNPNEDAKGVSGFHGEIKLSHSLIVNTYAGVSTKSSGALAVVRMDHCTVNAITRGVAAATKSTASAGNINFYMTNCVVNAADSIVSDFTPDKFVSVTYCSFRESWPGVGNINADPLFVAPQTGNYRLQANSPAINAGDPAYPLDLDGTRSDMGFYPRLSAPLTEPAVVINEIMYHPQSENPLEEYIELFNQSSNNVTLGGWRFSKGVNFVFPNLTLGPGGYLVVAANTNAFKAKYPAVANVIGNWTGTLSNSREDIVLDDVNGNTVDQVHYADEGDWAVRRRGDLDRGHRGWTWFAEHDGFGKSVELINPRMPNDNGQNWASSSVIEGTPGQPNSVAAEAIAPMIENLTHFPLVPKSTNDVLITVKILADQGLQSSATLFYRVDSASPPPFTSMALHDDGLNGDALAGDHIFSAIIPPQANNTVVEFYVKATDTLARSRTWPATAIASVDGAGPTGQVVNALYQVDDSEYTGTQPLYKIVMTEAERAELQQIDDNLPSSLGAANSDASMNATFLSFDGTGAEVRYLTSARNRGHGSRTRSPHNFRIGFRSDEEWKKMTSLNINGQFTWLQVVGAALNLRSGIPGAYSRAVQLRVNNANLAFTGTTDITYGSYAANEPIDSDWADRHFPNDSGGNIYRALRDITPPNFDYRTTSAYPTLFGAEDKRSYTNTWFKENNVSEDNWTDLIGMLRVIGPNGTEPFTPANASRVADVNEWLRHLAVMNLLGNNETGLNTGYNDDYFMYSGVTDPRFQLVYYDLDTILGFNGGLADNAQLFSAANNNGSGPAIGRLMHDPAFEPIYYAHLRDLIQTSFSADQFNLLVDETLGNWVPDSVRTQMKAWMDRRRTYVLSQLPANTPPLNAAHALVSAAPRSPTPNTSASFTISGANITSYKFSLNGGAFSAETPIATPINLNGLANGVQTLAVVGKRSDGVWQADANATTVVWTVNTSWPTVRLNEILADRSAGLKDSVELYNEGSTTVVLTGMGLTDDAANPHKYTFGAASLAPGAYLVLDSSELGFAFDAQGETVSLYDSAAKGSALLDSVTFGLQLTDLSIGRIGPNGVWQLTQPTLHADNVAQSTGDLKQIKINEWLASGISPFPDDFVELFNPQLLP
ncbi:MAG TPA: lamin tail domain-containing protein, partial [Verrucomicrobiae bacterium]